MVRARKSADQTEVAVDSVKVPAQVSVDSLKVRVVSYNVLSEKLCHRSEYFQCASVHLDARRRHEKIEKKLSAEMKRQSVICLQEVTVLFANRLSVFFERAGYHLVHDPYGGRRSGWMGVAIAYPRAVYSLCHQMIEEPTDERWIWQTVRRVRAIVWGGCALGQDVRAVCAAVREGSGV